MAKKFYPWWAYWLMGIVSAAACVLCSNIWARSAFLVLAMNWAMSAGYVMRLGRTSRTRTVHRRSGVNPRRPSIPDEELRELRRIAGL